MNSIVWKLVIAGCVLYVVAQVVDVLLLLFAGILLAIFLRGIGKWISHRTGLPITFCSLAVILIIFALVGCAIVASAPTISTQIDELTEKLPESLEKTKNFLMEFDLLRQVLHSPSVHNIMPSKNFLLGKSAPFATSILGGLGSLILVLVLGIYLSLHPQSYMHALIRLFPLHKRERVSFVLKEVESKLRWWIIGQFISMLTIGVLTTIGLMILGIPLAFLLGLIAALLTFIPNIGPILSAVPAVLFGFIESPETAVHVVLLYVAVQTVETYFVTPFVQHRTIELPPVIIILSQIILGILLGFIGLVLATPLTAAGLVILQYFYIEDVLHDTSGGKLLKDKAKKTTKGK